MKKKKEAQFKLLVHCNIHQIQEGFNANLQALPYAIEACYANLMCEGIQAELKREPHLIVVLLNKGDSDFLLPLKIKLFAPDIPILIITPSIPDAYKHFLEKIGVQNIIQLPAGEHRIRQTMLDILEFSTHGKP